MWLINNLLHLSRVKESMWRRRWTACSSDRQLNLDEIIITPTTTIVTIITALITTTPIATITTLITITTNTVTIIIYKENSQTQHGDLHPSSTHGWPEMCQFISTNVEYCQQQQKLNGDELVKVFVQQPQETLTVVRGGKDVNCYQEAHHYQEK